VTVPGLDTDLAHGLVGPGVWARGGSFGGRLRMKSFWWSSGLVD